MGVVTGTVMRRGQPGLLLNREPGRLGDGLGIGMRERAAKGDLALKPEHLGE